MAVKSALSRARPPSIWVSITERMLQYMKPITPAPTARKASVANIIRWKEVLWSSLFSTNTVSAAANCSDQGRFRVFVDFLAQAAQLYVKDLCLRLELVFPDSLEEHGTRHDLTRMAHQELKQPELTRHQRNFDTGALYGSRDEVHLKVADTQHRFLGFFHAPHHGFKTRDQFP